MVNVGLTYIFRAAQNSLTIATIKRQASPAFGKKIAYLHAEAFKILTNAPRFDHEFSQASNVEWSRRCRFGCRVPGRSDLVHL